MAGTATRQKPSDLEQAMAELAMVHARTEANLDRYAAETKANLDRHAAETTVNLDRLEANLDRYAAETTANMDRLEANLDRHAAETKAGIDRLEANIDRHLAATRVDLGLLSAEMRASEKSWAETRKELGAVSRRLGTMVEDIIAPGVVALFHQLSGGTEEPEWVVRTKRRHSGTRQTREFDVVAWEGDLLLVVQAKSTLRPEYIAEFVEALRDARFYFAEAKERRVVGAMASFRVEESLLLAGEKEGLVMMGMASGFLEILSSPGFRAREF